MWENALSTSPPAWDMPVFPAGVFEAAAVHADANGDMVGAAAVCHGAHMGLSADVAGVDADLGRTAFRRGDGKAVVKVDVRHERQRRTRRDCGKPLAAA